MKGAIPLLRGRRFLSLVLFICSLFPLFSFEARGESWDFTIPDCLPRCTAEDRDKLLEAGVLESKFIRFLRSSKKSIKFSLFTFSRFPLLDALSRKADEGVNIYGIVDRGQLKNLTSFCSEDQCRFPAPFNAENYLQSSLSERINQAKGQELYRKASVVEKLQLLFPGPHSPVKIRPAPGRSRLVHSKFAIVDDQKLLFGSGNWSSTAMSVNLENFVMLDGSGPEAMETTKAFRCIFDLIWQGNSQSINSLSSSCQVEGKVFFTPGPKGEESILQTILASISQAQQSVEIAMHHLTHEKIIQELLQVLRRGVEVKILFDDDDCKSHDSVGVRDLKRSGALIQYLYTSCQLFQLSHNKYVIIDKKLVINGTGNWSEAGLVKNYEAFILYDSPRELGMFSDNYESMWKFSRPKNQCWSELRDEVCPVINR